ncbi:aminotransferase-like domain-containing protein [Variovorax boronicumulans]|uniref:aminotransferase-like domain-containing protein n=1 Tax=Variovorax boronicumulans TaxID=436515 RepID=UPI001C59EEEA
MTPPAPFRLAQRAARIQPSIIREILNLAARPGVISLAGGLPSPDAFPLDKVREATQRVLSKSPREALQYAATEGFAPLREWVANDLAAQGLQVGPADVLITNGSQQGLDLVGKVLLDPGSTVAVESPTYVGALQAFNPYEARYLGIEGDDEGPLPQALDAAADARFLYLVPNFQNPTGRSIGAERRVELAVQARRLGLPLVEDNPYGDLWFDAPAPHALASHWPEGSVYLGSFSKVLAPGLRLGYVVAPPTLMPKLVQAKQAADLHTPIFNQHLVHEIVRDGFLAEHVPLIRERYRTQRDAMQAALQRRLPAGCEWQLPAGGMFFWVALPEGTDTMALLARAVALGVAYVPGFAFFADHSRRHLLRLSFVTVSPAQIDQGIALLARALAE